MNLPDNFLEMEQKELTIGEPDKAAQARMDMLEQSQKELAANIAAIAQDCIQFKEDKESGGHVPYELRVGRATKSLRDRVNILAHPSLGLPYIYREQEGYWQALQQKLHLFIRYNYLDQLFEKYALDNNTINRQVTNVAQEIADYRSSFGENSAITGNPNPNLILFKNGTYDFKTNDLREPQPEDCHTLQIPYNLVKNESGKTKTQEWLEWILEDSAQTLMELIGYCFYREYRYNVFTFMVNTPNTPAGGNGKSYVIDYIQKLLGDVENVSNVPLNKLTDTTDRFSTSMLQHKLANIESDMNAQFIEDTGRLKSLTGNDWISVERKGLDGYSFKNYAKLMFSTNHLPRFNDTSKGMTRRLIVLPFPKNLDTPEERKNIKKWNEYKEERVDYTNDEIGKFAWDCIQAFRNILNDEERVNQVNPFHNTQLALDMKQGYIEGNDSITQMLTELELEYSPDENDVILKSWLINAYKDYCVESGNKAMTKSNFTKALGEKGIRGVKTDGKPLKKRVKLGEYSSKNPQNIFSNIKFKDEAPASYIRAVEDTCQ